MGLSQTKRKARKTPGLKHYHRTKWVVWDADQGEPGERFPGHAEAIEHVYRLRSTNYSRNLEILPPRQK